MIGNKYLEYEVLYNLNDRDLGNACQINQYMNKLSKDDTFWMNRLIKRFLLIFESFDTIKEYKEKKNFSRWKDYYISLIYSMKMCHHINSAKTGYEKLDNYIKNKTKKYINGSFTDLLNEDFIDLNYIFIKKIINANNLNKEETLKTLLKFFDIPHFNISSDSILEFFDFYGEKSLYIILKRRNSIENRKIIMQEIYNPDYFYKLLPYMETFEEILDVLFKKSHEKSREGLNIDVVETFLSTAIKKGATKENIKKYLELNKNSILTKYIKKYHLISKFKKYFY